MFKTCLISSWMLLLPLAIVAQGCNPVKTYAFARPFIPGNAIAEDQPGGRPEDRIFIYQVYIEAACSQPPVIPVAWIKGKSYTASLSTVKSSMATAGVRQGSDDSVVIKASGKNQLYVVEFQEEPVQQKLPAAYAPKNAATKKSTANKIWLQLSVNGKTRMMQTPAWQLLQPQVVY